MSDREQGLSSAARVALGAESRLRVLLLLERERLSTTDIAAELKLSRQTVLHHVRALVDESLVRETAREPRAGGDRVYYGAAKGGWQQLVERINAQAGGGHDEPDAG